MRLQLSQTRVQHKHPHESSSATGVAQMALLCAAASLPLARPALADTAPERGEIRFKYLDYRETQPGADRVNVRASTASIMAPLGEDWSVTGSYIVDSISGASPAFHTERLTKLYDLRRAWGAGVTRYLPQGSLSVAGNYSRESDYVSRSLSVQGSLSTESKNTTLTAGVGTQADRIEPNGRNIRDTKNVNDFLVGVTQVLSPQDIAQATLSHSNGHGYYTDPYKLADERPRQRRTTRLLTRWNHHFESTGGTSRITYRYSQDSWAIRTHTATIEYAQPLSDGWVLTPLLRAYSQTAASFYLPVNPASPAKPTLPPASALYFSEDQRLSAFGALTVGLKVERQIDRDWSVDLKVDRYQQRASWSLSGGGDALLKPFNATWVQLGVSRLF